MSEPKSLEEHRERALSLNAEAGRTNWAESSAEHVIHFLREFFSETMPGYLLTLDALQQMGVTSRATTEKLSKQKFKDGTFGIIASMWLSTKGQPSQFHFLWQESGAPTLPPLRRGAVAVQVMIPGKTTTFEKTMIFRFVLALLDAMEKNPSARNKDAKGDADSAAAGIPLNQKLSTEQIGDLDFAVAGSRFKKVLDDNGPWDEAKMGYLRDGMLSNVASNKAPLDGIQERMASYEGTVDPQSYWANHPREIQNFYRNSISNFALFDDQKVQTFGALRGAMTP